MANSPTPKAARDRRLADGMASHVGRTWGLAAPQWRRLAPRCTSVSARRGEVLSNVDGFLPGIFIVAYGAVKLSLRGGNGEERVLRLVRAGETFGEEAALTGAPCRYEAAALADARLIVVPAAAVLEILDEHPQSARRLMLALCERANELIGELAAASLHTGAQRLAAYLNSLAEPAAAHGRLRVRLPVTKTLIAARLGVKKETLSRLLRHFSAQGVIQVSRHEVSILDPARLLDIASRNGSSLDRA